VRRSFSPIILATMRAFVVGAFAGCESVIIDRGGGPAKTLQVGGYEHGCSLMGPGSQPSQTHGLLKLGFGSLFESSTKRLRLIGRTTPRAALRRLERSRIGRKYWDQNHQAITRSARYPYITVISCAFCDLPAETSSACHVLQRLLGKRHHRGRHLQSLRCRLHKLLIHQRRRLNRSRNP
jgi:hypothetical protein